MPDHDRDHAESHDESHAHAAAAEPLGPVDVATWASALAGASLGLLVVLALLVARGG